MPPPSQLQNVQFCKKPWTGRSIIRFSSSKQTNPVQALHARKRFPKTFDWKLNSDLRSPMEIGVPNLFPLSKSRSSYFEKKRKCPTYSQRHLLWDHSKIVIICHPRNRCVPPKTEATELNDTRSIQEHDNNKTGKLSAASKAFLTRFGFVIICYTTT